MPFSIRGLAEGDGSYVERAEGVLPARGDHERLAVITEREAFRVLPGAHLRPGLLVLVKADLDGQQEVDIAEELILVGDAGDLVSHSHLVVGDVAEPGVAPGVDEAHPVVAFFPDDLGGIGLEDVHHDIDGAVGVALAGCILGRGRGEHAKLIVLFRIWIHMLNCLFVFVAFLAWLSNADFCLARFWGLPYYMQNLLPCGRNKGNRHYEANCPSSASSGACSKGSALEYSRSKRN